MIFTVAFLQNICGQNCSCSTNLRFVINKISENYSGYKDKVRPDNKSIFTAFTDSLLNAAKKADSLPAPQCMQILQKWVTFFKDGHMYYYSGRSAAPVNSDSVRKSYISWQKINYSETSFKQYLKKNKQLKPLEGLWQLDDYVAGVIFIKDRYKGFILKADSVYWMPGQVKFELPAKNEGSAIYYKRDHTADICSFTIDNQQKTVMTIGSYGAWYKTNEVTGKQIQTPEPLQNEAVFFKRLSGKTNLLTIRSFDNSYIHLIDSIVNSNDTLLRKTDNLVIDLRRNGGGADAAYDPLKKYLYTNPYKQIGVDLYCSDDNIGNFRKYASNSNFSKEDRTEFARIADSMSRHKQSFWSPFKDIEEIKMDSILRYPKYVAVLTDEYCGSTTEQFLLDVAKNSSKTTIIGRHSAGILDYANMNFLPLPCSAYEIGYATSRSKRIDAGKGIDNKGIFPDVELDSKTSNWLKYAQQYLENKR